MAGSRRVPEGPDPDPAVQKLRVRYAKRGRMRFTSTRDFQRALDDLDAGTVRGRAILIP